MPNIDTPALNSVLTTVGTIVGAVAAFLAWRAAHSASEAAHKSVEVAQAAERDRQWNALTPQFTYKCNASDDRSRAQLRINLDGPLALGQLDRVTVTIRDDRPDHGRQLLPCGPTAMQVASQIWGPYRLDPNVENVDRLGRSVTFPDGVIVGEDLVCALEQTLIPAWSENRNPDWWQKEYRGAPIRLTVECERDGHVPWRIPAEVPVAVPDPPPQIF